MNPDEQTALALQDGWRPNRPPGREPKRLAGRRFPEQLGAWLPFAAGIVVVLVLGAQGQPDVGWQADLILEKGVVEIIGLIGQMRLKHILVKLALHRPVSAACGQLLPLAEPGFILEIAIDGIEIKAKQAFVAVAMVVIRLEGQR